MTLAPPPKTQLDREGPGAPPRLNGELVFTAPWQSRLFGITLALHEAGRFEWDEFRQRLIDEIRAWEAVPEPKSEWSYYDCWGRAFEALLASKQMCGASEVEARVGELAKRPHGHDHDHDHHH